MLPFKDKLPRLQLFTLAVIALLLLLQTVLRIAFWFRFHNPDDPATLTDLVWSFYLGFKFDLRVAIYAALPLLLLGWIRPLHPVYSRFGRKLWLAYTTLVLLALLLFYATDFGHYAYLEQRLNATALRFLENPLISATMVWETYPVITGALLLLAITVICMIALRRITAEITPRPGQYGRWHQRTAVVVLTFFIVVFAGYGKLSWYPLRWSDAFFSTHAFVGQLASNPVLYFFNTLKNRKDTYDIEQVRKVYPLMAQYLGVEHPDEQKLDYTRFVRFEKKPDARPANLVIVFLESFASYKTGLSGNPLDPTPNIDRLAREGYYWKNFFVTQTGTARSVWTLVTGIPDIEKNKTSSRNPLIVDQYTIINSFDRHKKFYFLGGSASWANIRGLLAANIPRLDIHEEGSYESPRVDVWGISDLSLFEEANKVFKDLNEPFVAIIQTSGNHRPYTIPEYNAGFVEWTQADLKHDVTDYGFASLEELNSFRFMDHSIGHFIDIASKEAYFNDTLFVFFGDHGIHANTGRHVPKSEGQLGIQGLRVPLVMYGKGIITQPRVLDETASQVDVLPTVAAITGTSYINTTLGRNLLDPRYDDTRYAFTIEHGLDRVIGLLSDKYYLQMHYDGSGVKLHRLDSDSARDDVSAQHPDITRTMTDYLTAMRYTIPYMREHNRHEDAHKKESASE
jgi:phosphoglycerol transferase MdoB-like AlkP superfamily enzyme